MDKKTTRQERRALLLEQRRLLKKDKNYKEPTPHRTTHKQWPLALVGMGFFFFSAVLALVLGGHMWDGHGWFPKTLGWAIAISVLIYSFIKWIKLRKTFVFKRGWITLLFVAFCAAVVSAFLFCQTISGWQESEHLTIREQQHQALIKQASSWRQGQRWDAQMCDTVNTQQQQFVNDLRNETYTPFISELFVLLGTLQVRYQAGCDANWQEIYQKLSENNPKWRNLSQKKIADYNRFLVLTVPTNKDGCWMDKEHYYSKGDQKTAKALNHICQENLDDLPWNSSFNYARAQEYIALEERLGPTQSDTIKPETEEYKRSRKRIEEILGRKTQ